MLLSVTFFRTMGMAVNGNEQRVQQQQTSYAAAVRNQSVIVNNAPVEAQMKQQHINYSSDMDQNQFNTPSYNHTMVTSTPRDERSSFLVENTTQYANINRTEEIIVIDEDEETTNIDRHNPPQQNYTTPQQMINQRQMDPTVSHVEQPEQAPIPSITDTIALEDPCGSTSDADSNIVDQVLRHATQRYWVKYFRDRSYHGMRFFRGSFSQMYREFMK